MRKSEKEALAAKEDLAREKQRARERIRYVRPQTAGKVLGHDRYWTVQFLRLYLELCDETAFDVPRDAYLLAQHLPEVARRIRVGERAAEWDTPIEKMGGIVMALAVKGSCCRAAQEFAEATLCFDRAFQGLGGHTVAPIVSAELHRRYAALFASTHQNEDAMKHLNESLALCEQAEYGPGLADALALRGYLLSRTEPAEAISDFLEAARVAELKTERGKRTAQAAIKNLAGTIALGGVGLTHQEAALRHLQVLKNDLKGTPTSVRKVRLLWIEGLLLANLRIDRHAKRQLQKARQRLADLKAPVDFALVSVDLVRFLLVDGDRERAREIAEDTLRRLSTLGMDETRLEIVRRWTAEPERLDVTSTDEAYRRLLVGD